MMLKDISVQFIFVPSFLTVVFLIGSPHLRVKSLIEEVACSITNQGFN